MANYQPNYGNIIWTDHALERLAHRGLDQQQVYLTVVRPTVTRKSHTRHTKRHMRRFGHLMVEAIVSTSDDNRPVVLSCWAKPAKKFKSKKPLWEKILRYLFRKI